MNGMNNIYYVYHWTISTGVHFVYLDWGLVLVNTRFYKKSDIPNVWFIIQHNSQLQKNNNAKCNASYIPVVICNSFYKTTTEIFSSNGSNWVVVV